MTSIMDAINRHNISLVRASSHKGGEYHGPCPACGGTDRFHVWPGQGKDGTFWCRMCGIAGDTIQFLRDVDGLSFAEACDRLGRPKPDRPAHSAQRHTPMAAPAWTPDAPQPAPNDTWRERAAAMAQWSAAHLERSPHIQQWLAARGISMETARRFNLGHNPGENGRDIYRPRQSWALPEVMREDGRPKKLWLPSGLVIPWSQDGLPVRLRIRRPEGEPKYYVIPGSTSAIMAVPPARSTARAWVLVEAELDAVLLAGVIESAGLDVGVMALGTARRKPDSQTAAILSPALAILLALDFDQAGNSALKFWSANFPRARHHPPVMGKDPGEDFSQGVDLAAWIREGLPPALTQPLRSPVPAGVDQRPDPLDGPDEAEGCVSGGGGPCGDGQDVPAKMPGHVHPKNMPEHELAEVRGLPGVDLMERLLWSCTQMRLYAVANDRDGCGTRGCNQCWKYRNEPPCNLPYKVGAIVCNNPTAWEFVHTMPDGRYHPQDRYVRD